MIPAPPPEKYSNHDLWRACREGDKERVENIIANGDVDVNENDKTCGYGPLYCAVLMEHPIIVKALLDCKETRLDVLDEEDGMTALHQACWGNAQEQTECLKIIVNDYRCDSALVNIKDKKGNTALYTAVFHSNVDAVKILLNYPGIELDPEDRTENSPFIRAQKDFDMWWGLRRDPDVRSQHKEAKEILDLLKAKASIIELCAACKRGENATVKEILAKHEVDVNGTDTCGHPPLFNAVLKNHPSTLQLLLENSDVRLDFVDQHFNNWTVLHWACFGSDDKKCTECVEILVNDSRCNSDLVNSKNTKGDTPISHAVFKGNYEAVKILSSYPGIKMDSKDNAGNSLITIAESQCGRKFDDESKNRRHEDILSFLREKQQGVNTEKTIRTIESVSSLIEIMNKMQIVEIAITSAEEIFETQLQDLKEEHREKIKVLKRKLNDKRNELVACIHD